MERRREKITKLTHKQFKVAVIERMFIKVHFSNKTQFNFFLTNIAIQMAGFTTDGWAQAARNVWATLHARKGKTGTRRRVGGGGGLNCNEERVRGESQLQCAHEQCNAMMVMIASRRNLKWRRRSAIVKNGDGHFCKREEHQKDSKRERLRDGQLAKHEQLGFYSLFTGSCWVLLKEIGHCMFQTLVVVVGTGCLVHCGRFHSI